MIDCKKVSALVAKNGWLHDEIVDYGIYVHYLEDLPVDILSKKSVARPRYQGIYIQPSLCTYGIHTYEGLRRGTISRIFSKDNRNFQDLKLALFPIHRNSHFILLILVKPDMILEVNVIIALIIIIILLYTFISLCDE